MSFGHPSFIATHLFGDDVPVGISWVRSETVLFGSTTGPFSGFGGSAMTLFTITEILVRSTDGGPSVGLIFCDETFLGWYAAVASAESDLIRERFPNLDDRTPGLNTDASTCPVPLPERVLR